ncbi:hypothetical protein PO909_000671 [Leuciscus waleckii]
MGRNGSGKSSSRNTILGERKFKVKNHESEVCDGKTQIGDKQVCVIDSPDLLDPDLNKEKMEKMKDQLVSRCSSICCPAKAKDLNSLECETEKNDFKVSVFSRQKYYR